MDVNHQHTWKCRDREFILGDRALVMGILNLTPDSFSDGGRHMAVDDAERAALEMIEQGADIIDLGGESTRPGAQPVSTGEELRRVMPVVERLAGRPGFVLSVDTTKSEVAAAALQGGAHIINDVSALTNDPAMADVVRRYGAGLVLMHMRGSPANMQNDPRYLDVVGEVSAFLRARIDTAVGAGIAAEQVVVDPGIGFGKNLDHNLALLRAIPAIAARCARPVLIGASRKRLIGDLTGRSVGDRLAGSLALMSYAILRGARIIRVHDVKESCDTARMLATLGKLEDA